MADDDVLDPIPPSIYWGGCGFGSAFYIGVHRAMVERWGSDFHKHTMSTGGSAGSMMAIQVCLGKSTEDIASMYQQVAKESLRRGSLRYASECLVDGMKNIVQEYYPNSHQLLHGLV